MAKMVRFHAFGAPDVLRIEQVPTPVPGPGEVLLAVEAIGVNRAEALWRMNQYVEEAKLPAGLGNEAAGTIAAIGPDVRGLSIGDRVAGLPGAGEGGDPT